MSTTTLPAPISVKLTKGAVIALLTTIAAAVATYAAANPSYVVLAALIGWAVGDAITFLQGSTLTDKWTYASVNVLLIAILSTVGTFVGQLVNANVASPMIGALVGYAIGYAITLLDTSQTTPTPPVQ